MVAFVCVSCLSVFSEYACNLFQNPLSKHKQSLLHFFQLTFSAIFSFLAHVKTNNTRYRVVSVRMVIPVIRQEAMTFSQPEPLLFKSRNCHRHLAHSNLATTFKQENHNKSFDFILLQYALFSLSIYVQYGIYCMYFYSEIINYFVTPFFGSFFNTKLQLVSYLSCNNLVK